MAKSNDFSNKIREDNLNTIIYPFSKMEESNVSLSSTPSFEKNIEPLLIPDEGRYVMFPIKHNDVWNMYKKQMDSFWRCEEINMSKDLTEWEKMNDDEKYFIKMVLAFFAASDGIVLENLAQRFMNDIENSEIRAFYSMQIFMENIHCVSEDTLILTKTGYFKIGELVNKNIEVWNGEEFSMVTIKYTGNNDLYRVQLSNGMYLDCTDEHKWVIANNPELVHTKNLEKGMEIVEFKYPCIENTEDNPVENFSQKNSFLDIKSPNKPPINSSNKEKIAWLNCNLKKHAKISSVGSKKYLCFQTIHYFFLKELQLLFSTIEISSHVLDNDLSFILIVVLNEINNDIFIKHGVKLESIDEKKYDNYLLFKAELPLHVIGVYKISDDSPTYCFNEPKRHTGIFNGVLTGQSEMYSILIDTYSSNKVEKDKLLNAIQHFPCIKKKAEWAKRWINDKDTTFASRLVAFAIVEGIFFSSSFASIYWIKKRGMLHGLTLSNEFISRDEALHVEFAVLLYHKLINKLNKEDFYKIMQEAVNIEKEFILEAIPCRLIGMNSDLMSQYIEFVSNRLCLQLGYDKLFPHATNPFDFMELISLNDKVNFFEKTNTQYALANKVVEGDPFDFTSNF
jgi:ribonucleotide reductase beta subunit family protein with ferritin-like domain